MIDHADLFSDAFGRVEEALDRVLGVNVASTKRGVTTEQKGEAADPEHAGIAAGAGVSPG